MARSKRKTVRQNLDESTPPRKSRGLLGSLFGIDSRSLALFRILAAILLLYDLATRSLLLRVMYTDDGVMPTSLLREANPYGLFLCLHSWEGSYAFQAALFLIAAVFAVALLVGFYTRVATVGCWLLLVSMHLRMPVTNNGGDVLLSMLLFWGMFVPLGRRWSIDALRSDRTLSDDDRVLSMATAAMLLQVAIMYFFTGLYKLNDAWFSGEALHRALSHDTFVRPLGKWLLELPLVLRLLTWGTLGLELFGPILFFVPWGRRVIRPLLIVAFFGLHVGIELTMSVAIFSFASMTALMLFLPTAFWNSAPVRRIGNWVLRLAPQWLEPQSPTRVDNGDESHPVRTGTRLSVMLSNLVCAVVLLFVVAWNFASFTYSRLGLKWTDVPVFLRTVASVTPFAQEWTMFDRPRGADHWYIAHAWLENGKEVDLLRDGQGVNSDKPPAHIELFPTARGLMYYAYLPIHHRVWRDGYAKYLCRQWNSTHQGSDRAAYLELSVRYPSIDHDVPPLASVSLGPYRWQKRYDNGNIAGEGTGLGGREQGPWRYWFEDGAKSMEGEYVDGVRHGYWVFWTPAGRKEGEGAFVDGVQHGDWRYWYEDGTTRRVYYENGQEK